MATRSCTINDNQVNAHAATEAHFSRSFAPVTIAIIKIVDKTVYFKAKGSTVLRTTSWEAPDLWSGCPTELEMTNKLPAIGDQGIVYLGVPVWDKLDNDATQYSPGPKWPEEMSARWAKFRPDVLDRMTPNDLAFDTLGFRGPSTSGLLDALPISPSYQNLPLVVARVEIEAAVDSQSELLTFDLLAEGNPRQVLDLSKVYTTLRLLDPKTGQPRDVRMQILHARLCGKHPNTGIENTVDLLAPKLSDAFQIIDFTADSVAPRLSQNGFAMFGVGWHPQGVTSGLSSPSLLPPPPKFAPGGAYGPNGSGSERVSIVTFLARPAAGISRIPEDGNTAIDELRDALTEAESHELFEVSSLVEIAQCLDRLHAKPDTIQIVGHGAPGMLSLGYYWDPSKYTDNESGPFYLLDSNPYTYGVLSSWIEPSTRVLLVGCNVGSNQPSPMVARGRSLIFDLHDMWGCDVLAADDLVGPKNFRGARFVGSAQGYVRGRWRKSPGIIPAPQPVPASTDAPVNFSDVTIKSAPGLGGTLRAFNTPIQVNVDHYSQEISLGPVLAMHELALRGKVDGQEADLYVICNSRFLKAVIQTGTARPHVRYFSTKKDAMRLAEHDDNIFESLASENPGEDLWREARRWLDENRLSSYRSKSNGTSTGKVKADLDLAQPSSPIAAP